MTTEEIQKFIKGNKVVDTQPLKITFKKRNPVMGVFVEYKDAAELQAKNFWRVVSVTHFDEWKKSKDINLSRLFNGSDFSKIVVQ